MIKKFNFKTTNITTNITTTIITTITTFTASTSPAATLTRCKWLGFACFFEEKKIFLFLF